MKIGKWYETHDHRAEQLQYDSLMPEVQLNLSFMRPQDFDGTVGRRTEAGCRKAAILSADEDQLPV